MQLEAELKELDAKPRPELTADNLARIIELWTKIPASSIREDEFERLAHLEDRLKEHIVGQDEAVDAVCAAIRRSRVGLQVKRKPVSFIFVGGTGVGKTELVKRLAEDLFQTPESLIRLDMSEFMEKFSVSRIIGSPPGYVGYDEAGQLTEKIRRKPYSVVLFDEIEKAHPDVMNILLQILDDGRITDAQGRTVNFENTVIVMTTNAGSGNKTGSVGFGGSLSDMSKERAMKALNDFLRPEFLNRVDEIICFNKLSEENFRGIAALMLGEVRDVLRDKDIDLSWDESVIDHLVKEAYSVTYGARNLRRVIQKQIEDELARRIVENHGTKVGAIRLSAADGKIQDRPELKGKDMGRPRSGCPCPKSGGNQHEHTHRDHPGRHHPTAGGRHRQRGQHLPAGRGRRGRGHPSGRRAGAAGGVPHPPRLPHRRGEAHPGLSSACQIRHPSAGPGLARRGA